MFGTSDEVHFYEGNTTLESLVIDEEDGCPAPLSALSKVTEQTSLEELHLSGWCSITKNRHRSSTPRHIGGPQKLALPESIGQLSRLRHIVISGSEISSLPDSFFGLPVLESLEIYPHSFSTELVAKIHDSFPRAQIDLDNLKPPHSMAIITRISLAFVIASEVSYRSNQKPYVKVLELQHPTEGRTV